MSIELTAEQQDAVDFVALVLGEEVDIITDKQVFFKSGWAVYVDSPYFEKLLKLAAALEDADMDASLLYARLSLKIANQAQQIRQLNGAIERRNRKINGLRVKNADLKQALDDESEAVDNLLADFNDVPKPKKEPKLIASADPVRGVTIYDHGFWGADVTMFGGEV